MRLLSLYLKNYINIYNALNRNELYIDFSKCKNRILVIRSENGAGKTSIINELHPFFSSSTLWMYDVPIEKKIQFYLNDNSIIDIEYSGWRAKNTKNKVSKCYIYRKYLDNDKIITLNPTGNINLGKDIISELLDIDDDYITLSALSANSKGICNMKPSERKKYLSLILTQLDPYIKMNKDLVQKSVVLKNLLQTMTVKLSQLGNIEIIQSNMDKNNKELELLKEKHKKITEQITENKLRLKILLEGYQNPEEEYKNKLAKRSIMEFNIKDISKEVLNFDENVLKDLYTKKIKIELEYNALENEIHSLSELEESLREELDKSLIQLNSIFNEDLIKGVKDKLEENNNKLNAYIKCFNALNFENYNNITESEYNMILNIIDEYNKSTLIIGNEYDEDIKNEACKYINTQCKIINYREIIDSYKDKIIEINKVIEKQKMLEERAKNYNEIPKDCKHINNCPFIIDIVKAKNEMLDENQYNNILKELDILKNNIEKMKELEIRQDKILSCRDQIKNIMNTINNSRSILTKFPNVENLLSNRNLINSIINGIPININTDVYREYSNYITLIKNCQNDIISYNNRLKELTNSNKEVWKLQQLIEIKTKELNTNTNKKIDLINHINTKSKDLNNIIDTINKLEEDKKRKDLYESISSELKEINQEINKLYTIIQEYTKLNNNINNLIIEEKQLNTISIPQLQNEIEKAKYQLILYNEYRRDYTNYSNTYEELEEVKQATSIHGIQADIMNIQMKEMLSMINQLAAMMFGARFNIKEFNINENEFSIPVYDKEANTLRPDITLMSNSQLSQLSMIITFVLLYNSSKKYNIIRLDEVDNNLDNDNRFRFFDLVNTIMDILGFDQCIMISHNYELDLHNCDIIITRIQNDELYKSVLYSGGNIIANFMVE